jgi:hypothetical protein
MTIVDPRSVLSHPCIRFVFDCRSGSPRYCSSLRRQSCALIGRPRVFRRRVPEYIEVMLYRFDHTEEASSQTMMVLSTDCASFACGCSFASCQIFCVASLSRSARRIRWQFFLELPLSLAALLPQYSSPDEFISPSPYSR